MPGPRSLTELSRLPPAEVDRIRAGSGAIRLPGDRSVAVLRHDAVTDGLSHPQLVARHRFRTTIRLYGGSTVIDSDGADHQRQRKPVVRGLMASMEAFARGGEIDSIAAKAVAALHGLEAPDLVQRLAVRVVTEVMASMTGLLPAESLHLYSLHRPIVSFLVGDVSAFAAARANLEDALKLFADRDLLGMKADAPLVQALREAARDNSLTEPEFRRNRVLLFMGGTETAVCALSNTLWTIASTRGLIGRLRESSPAQLRAAVAEMLRLQPPLFSLTRFAAGPIEICDIAVEGGTAVHLCIGAACRDSQRFSDPERLVLTRPDPTDLVFGHRVHFCPGAPIAHLEIAAVLRALLREVRDIRLLDDPPPTISGTTFRVPVSLHASVEWAGQQQSKPFA